MSEKDQIEETDLKVNPAMFTPIVTGQKNFIRMNRLEPGYKIGQLLLLREYIQEKDIYTGRTARVLIQCLEDVQLTVIIGFRPPIVVFQQASDIKIEDFEKVLQAEKNKILEELLDAAKGDMSILERVIEVVAEIVQDSALRIN